MDHYRRRIKELIHEYNRDFPLPYYFERFLKHKQHVTIADLGSGPICTLGNLWGNVKIDIYASDILAPDYKKLIEEQKCNLQTPIEFQNIENLTYQDDFFDVVHCVNTLDHTLDVQKAIDELKRICKPGGYIYLRHGHNQLKVNKGKGHYWNATKNGFSNQEKHVALDGFTTADDGYFLTSTLKKE